MRPNVFTYQNYREFLREFYTFEKNSSDNFSYRAFSKRAGFKSPNFLKLVIEGDRNLTLKSIGAICRALKLSTDEGFFFRNLVLLNQAKNSIDKTEYLREISNCKVFRELYPLQQAALDFYQKWYCIPLRELISSPYFREEPEWIARQLRPAITAQEAAEALQTLLLLGLIRRDDNGRLVQCQKNVTTGNEVQSAAVVAFHKQMIQLGSLSMDGIKRYQRDVSSATVMVSENTFLRFKELVQNFRKTLLAEAESQSFDQRHAVYQINFQIFPITEVITAEEEQAPCKKVS